MIDLWSKFQLKWFKTWKLYLYYLLVYSLNLVATIGFALTRYGQYAKTTDSTEKDGWWYFLCCMTIYINVWWISGLIDSIRIWYYFREPFKEGNFWRRSMLNLSFFPFWLANILFMICQLVLPHMMIFGEQIGNIECRYISAITVMVQCFHQMIMLSRMPSIGLYLFMMKRVTISIFRFFLAYFWNFFGYAIAFHIIMPQNGAFKNFDDALIKVKGGLNLPTSTQWPDSVLHRGWQNGSNKFLSIEPNFSVLIFVQENLQMIFICVHLIERPQEKISISYRFLLF